MLLRKARAGSDSFGHTWETDGAVVDVPDVEASVLLRIRDGGFSEVYEPEGNFAEVAPEAFPAKVLKPVAPKLRNPVSKGIELDTFTE
jgi:hypothetical protein